MIDDWIVRVDRNNFAGQYMRSITEVGRDGLPPKDSHFLSLLTNCQNKDLRWSKIVRLEANQEA